ncbi:MAG: hypothetical protein JHC33_02585 [Ignisphaera sp.]|nr:hypothetical protein [Ignisphaera sp.]
MERATNSKTGLNALDKAIEWSKDHYDRKLPTAEGVAVSIVSDTPSKIVYDYLVIKGDIQGTVGNYPIAMPFDILNVKVGTLTPKEIDQYALETVFNFDPKTFEVTYNGVKYFVGNLSETDPQTSSTTSSSIISSTDSGSTDTPPNYYSNSVKFANDGAQRYGDNAYNDLYIPSINEAVDSYIAIHYPDSNSYNSNYYNAYNEMRSKYANQAYQSSYIRYDLSNINEEAFIASILLNAQAGVLNFYNFNVNLDILSHVANTFKIVYIPIYGDTSQYPDFSTNIANIYKESVFPPVFFSKDVNGWYEPEGIYKLSNTTRTKRPCAARNDYINNTVGNVHETYKNIGECYNVTETNVVPDGSEGVSYTYTTASYFDVDVTTTTDVYGAPIGGGHPWATQAETILDMLGYTYKDIYGSLKGNLQSNGDIQTVSLNFGIKLNTNSSVGKEYIYAFMEMLYNTMGKTAGGPTSDYYDPNDPGAGHWAFYGGSGLFGNIALDALKDDYIIKEFLYNYVLSGRVTKELINSSSLPLGAVTVEHIVTPAVTVSDGSVSSEDGSSGYTTIPATDDYVVTKQVTETQQIRYTSVRLQQRHSILVKDRWMDATYTAPADQMYFPLEMNVLNSLNSMTANDVVRMALMTTIFAGKVTTTSPIDSWTQLGKGIVGIVIMAFCEGCAPYVMAAMAMTVALSPILSQFLGSGNILLQIVAVVIIVVIAWVGSGGGSWDKLLNVKYLVNTVSTAYTIYVKGELNAIEAKLKGLSEQYDAALKKIEDETEELGLDPSIDVGEEYTRLGLVESITGFFTRTTDSSYTMHSLNINNSLDLNARLALPI